MQTTTYKREIYSRLRKRPRLTPFFGGAHAIPERVREYDSSFFVCFNHVKDRFEIHSLENIGDTYCFSVPYKQLDARVITWLWENDLKLHGRKIFERLERDEERRKASEEREWKNWVEAVGKETHSMFAQDAWNL